MSQKNVKAFFEKVESDKGLQAKLQALEGKSEPQMTAATAELVKIAADAGFKFTAEEFAAARKASIAELSPEELAAVAAGRKTSGDSCYFTLWLGLCTKEIRE